MKKRVIFLVAAILTVATSLLMVSIFHLYKDAETVQRSIFSKEVAAAANDIMNKIDRVLKGDTLPMAPPMKPPVKAPAKVPARV